MHSEDAEIEKAVLPVATHPFGAIAGLLDCLAYLAQRGVVPAVRRSTALFQYNCYGVPRCFTGSSGTAVADWKLRQNAHSQSHY